MSFNTVKTAALLALLSAVLIVGGGAISGRNGMYIGLTLAVVMNFSSYFFSDKIALMSYAAQPVSETQNPEVFRRVGPIVRNLCQRMGLPMPKLWIIPEDSPNAFATGRNPQHASVAFTSGILRLMDDREIEGVVAHELGHVLHRDILISSVAATLAAAITMLARLAFWFGPRRDDDREGGIFGALAMMILAPIAAMLIQMAISRAREYQADKGGAEVTSNPLCLANALRKLQMANQQIPMQANAATAHMFIVNPLSGDGLRSLFSTHPPLEERVRRLEEMAYGKIG